jgi:hypothetical protein
MMTWKQIVHTLSVTMLLFLASCSLVVGTPVGGNTGEPTIDPQAQVAQIVAATMAAQTQIALSVQQTLAALITDTPPPSSTSQFTYTPLPTYTPQATSTSGTPMVSVSVQTNCRSGPGTAYDILGVLPVGQSAEVVGRSVYSDNWIIKLPSNPAITCWLWVQYATVVGDTAGLPVFNPPPTPTPSPTFTVVYTGTIYCAPQYAFRFDITNNGSITWQSIQITITDNTTAAVFVHSLDTFRSYNGCTLDLDQQDLTPGETGPVSNVSPGQIGYNPAGHSFTAVFRLCSENGLAGTCLEKTLSFNP